EDRRRAGGIDATAWLPRIGRPYLAHNTLPIMEKRADATPPPTDASRHSGQSVELRNDCPLARDERRALTLRSRGKRWISELVSGMTKTRRAAVRRPETLIRLIEVSSVSGGVSLSPRAEKGQEPRFDGSARLELTGMMDEAVRGIRDIQITLYSSAE